MSDNSPLGTEVGSYELNGQVVRIFCESLNQPVFPDYDETEWHDVNEHSVERDRLREQARFLARKHPNIKRALLLYDIYVLGNDLTVYMAPDVPDDPDISDTEKKRISDVRFYSEKRWRQTLEANKGSWSVSEKFRRGWRDGEDFTRVIKIDEFPLRVRHIEPEDISDGNDGSESTKGIITAPNDVTVPTGYQVWDAAESRVVDTIPAENMHHTKVDVDSNEKRGRSRFESVISTAMMLMALVRNEVAHRNAQSSIVLVRKVAGTKQNAANIVDNAQTGVANYNDTGAMQKEKWRPGTILTTSKNVEIEFKQPESNFSDASPLLKMLLQQISAATGWSYSQLTADPSDGNFASSLVAESPVLQMVERERMFVRDELTPFVKQVFQAAIAAGKLEGITSNDDVWEDWKVVIEFGDVVSRDEIKIAQAANLGVMTGSLSKAEFARRVGADPVRMKNEIRDEMEDSVSQMGVTQVANPMAAHNPTADDKLKSSADNAGAGGTNQGAGTDPAGHSDKLT